MRGPAKEFGLPVGEDRMYRIGYAPGAFDLLPIGHLDLFRQAKSQCDFLIAGVASDEIILEYKGALPVIPLGALAANRP